MVSRRREGGHTRYHPLLNMQARGIRLSLSQIVTGDETWGHHFEPESKRQSKHRKRATSPPPKKLEAVHTSSGKVMIPFFFLPQGSTAYRVSGTGNHHSCPALSSLSAEL
ncbi:hypothetical protein TNCV_2268171 [Trichonephila clavipes]|nr:hypothetical protein TNCV_2268171 [Trichonephila clavipes]